MRNDIFENEEKYESADKSRFDEISLKALPCSHSPIFAKKKKYSKCHIHTRHSLI